MDSNKSNQSLFSKHVALLTEDESHWTSEQKREWERITSLDLPALKLPKDKKTLWQQWKLEWEYGLAALTIASLVVLLLPPGQKETAEFVAKGTIQASVFYERDGEINRLEGAPELRDGDIVGAKVISTEDSVAYWTITDKDLKSLDDQKEIESSRIDLPASQSESFKSSFKLVAPNQGENLIIIVCSKPKTDSTKADPLFVLDRGFLSEVLEKQKAKANDCVYIGFRLRKAP